MSSRNNKTNWAELAEMYAPKDDVLKIAEKFRLVIDMGDFGLAYYGIRYNPRLNVSDMHGHATEEQIRVAQDWNSKVFLSLWGIRAVRVEDFLQGREVDFQDKLYQELLDAGYIDENRKVTLSGEAILESGE